MSETSDEDEEDFLLKEKEMELSKIGDRVFAAESVISRRRAKNKKKLSPRKDMNVL